jgi:hypothetical protein
MEFFLHDDTGATTLSYVTEVTLTPEWKQYSYRFSEFKPAGPNSRGTTLAPGRIGSFTIECPASSSQILEMQLDTLRVEAARAQK